MLGTGTNSPQRRSQPAPVGPRWVLQEGSFSPRGRLGGGLDPSWALLGGTLAAPELPTCVSAGRSRPRAAVLGGSIAHEPHTSYRAGSGSP